MSESRSVRGAGVDGNVPEDASVDGLPLDGRERMRVDVHRDGNLSVAQISMTTRATSWARSSEAQVCLKS